MVKCELFLPLKEKSTTKKPKIVIVDDELDNLYILSSALLRSTGYEIQAFGDPVKALDYFRKNADLCTVVITDIRMTGMSGFELARLIRGIRQDTKIVFMTAFEMNRSEFESVFPTLQVDGFIQKPFSPKALIEIVESQLTA